MGVDSGFVQAARSAAAVTQLAVSTVVGGLLGQWGDAWLLTTPLLAVLGFISGFAAGLYGLFRILPSSDDPEPTDDDEPEP